MAHNEYSSTWKLMYCCSGPFTSLAGAIDNPWFGVLEISWKFPSRLLDISRVLQEKLMNIASLTRGITMSNFARIICKISRWWIFWKETDIGYPLYVWISHTILRLPCTQPSHAKMKISGFRQSWVSYCGTSFGDIFDNSRQYIYVICRLGGPYGEKLWPRSWKCCPRPQAEVTVFHYTVSLYSFSSPRSQFFTIRTDPKPANNESIFLSRVEGQGSRVIFFLSFFFFFSKCHKP